MYLEIDEGFPGNRKTLRLCSLMDDPKAGWYMVWLWTWACRSCQDGDLRGLGAFEIEEAARYQQHDGRLCSAMIDAGFVDKDESGAPTGIHNWMRRTGAAIKKMGEKAKENRKRRADARSRHDAGKSENRTSTVPVQGENHTAHDATQTRQDQTRQDQTRERDPEARAHIERSAPPNEPGKPSPYGVVAQYLALRGQLVVGQVASATKGLSLTPQPGDVDKAATWLAAMAPEDCSDIVPAMKLACEHVRDGVPGWNKPEMGKACFLFGAIVRFWPDLREELHGCAPKIKPRVTIEMPPQTPVLAE